MKAIIIAVLLVAGLMFIGWITVDSNAEKPTVSFDTQEAKEDTTKAVQVGKEIVADGKELISDAVETVKEKSAETPVEQKQE